MQVVVYLMSMNAHYPLVEVIGKQDLEKISWTIMLIRAAYAPNSLVINNLRKTELTLGRGLTLLIGRSEWSRRSLAELMVGISQLFFLGHKEN